METAAEIRRRRFEQDALPHLDTLWRTALWLTRRRRQADDLVVRTMAEAYRGWDVSDCALSARVRLLRMLTNRYFGEQGRSPTVEPLFPESQGSAASIGGPGRQVREQRIRPADLLVLHRMSLPSFIRAVARLGAQARLMMILSLRERLSHADIAYITDLPREAVRADLSRLRRVLPGYLVQSAESTIAALDLGSSGQMLLASSDDG